MLASSEGAAAILGAKPGGRPYALLSVNRKSKKISASNCRASSVEESLASLQRGRLF